MSDLTNKVLTPARLHNLRFRIPLYQRPYAWGDLEVRQFLDDLKAASETTREPLPDYHIGILGVGKSDDNEVYDLIDGQQRITTLALIAKAANKDWFKGRLDLYGRPEDNKYLSGDDEANCNQRMKETVKLASEYLKDCPKLAAYIYEHAAFFLSIVPDGYTLLDKNQQFVRFQNRGRQLEKHEILKVRLIGNEGFPHEQRGDAFQVWNTMTELLSGVSGDNGNEGKTNLLKEILDSNMEVEEYNQPENLYRAIVGVEEFLLIALARTNGADRTKISQNKGELLNTFNQIMESPQIMSDFIKVLKRQTDALRKYFIFINNGNGKYEIGKIKDEKEAENAAILNEYDLGVIDVQSFLYVSTLPHKWMIPAFDWLEEKLEKSDSSRIADEFGEELRRIDNDECDRPSLPQLAELAYGNVLHYWFYRLDYELLKLWRNKGKEANVWSFVKPNDEIEALLNCFRFRRCGSVEHIIPRHQIENRTISSDDSFRNLALILASRNSKLNNNPPSGKKDIILGSKYIESLKLLHALWSGQSADEHAQTMYDILKKAVSQTQPTEPKP